MARKKTSLLKNIEGRCIPTEDLQVTKKLTLDTRENRFLKFMLINLTGKFYHTKCSNINLAEHNIKFVALAQSKRQFADDGGITYYGKSLSE
jgi:predicted component of viral defense system (DUF524 family)